PYTTLFRSRRLGAKKRCDRLQIELAFIAGHGFVSGKCWQPEDHAQRQAESHDCGCELHRLASFRGAGFDIRCTAAPAIQTTKMGRLPQLETQIVNSVRWLPPTQAPRPMGTVKEI